MPIKFSCPNKHPLSVKDHLAGKVGKCPKCGVKVRVPSPQVKATVAEEQMPVPAVAASALPSSLKPPKPKQQDRSENDVPKKRNSWVKIFAVAGVALTLLAIAGVAIVFSLLGNSAPAKAPSSPAVAKVTPSQQVKEKQLASADQQSETETSAVTDKQVAAPETSGPGVKLLEAAEWFSFDDQTGSLAALTRDKLYLYSREYLESGKGRVVGPVEMEYGRASIAFKQLDDRSLFVIGKLNSPTIVCYDANTLEPVQTIETPCRHVTHVDASGNSSAERIYFSGNNSPLNQQKGSEVYVADLSSTDSKGLVKLCDLVSDSSFSVSNCGAWLLSANARRISEFNWPEGEIAERLNGNREPIISGPLGKYGFASDRIFLLADPIEMVASRLHPFNAKGILRNHPYAFAVVVRGNPEVSSPADGKELLVRSNKKGALTVYLDLVDLHDPVKPTPYPTDAWKNQELMKALVANGAKLFFFEDHQSGCIRLCCNDWTYEIPLDDKELATREVFKVVVDGPATVNVGDQWKARLSVPGVDRKPKFTFSEVPDGLTVVGAQLQWQPTADQVGENMIRIHWNTGTQSGGFETMLTVNARPAENALPFANRIPIPFEIKSMAVDPDQQNVIATGKKIRSSKSMVAVANLHSGKTVWEFETDVPVHHALVDDHHVYLLLPGINGSTIRVLSRSDKSVVKELFHKSRTPLAVVGNQFFAATEVYAVPSLEAVAGVIEFGMFFDWFERNEDGFRVKGQQYDHDQKKIQMIHLIRYADRDHWALRNHMLYSRPRSGNGYRKEVDVQNRFRLTLTEGGIEVEDRREHANPERFRSKPRFVAKQSSFVFDREDSIRLEYEIVGGKAPYTAGPQHGLKPIVDNKATLEIDPKQVEESYKKFDDLLDDKLRDQKNRYDKQLRVETFDGIVRELNSQCENLTGIAVKNGMMAIPVRAGLLGRDSNRSDFYISHWIFVTVPIDEVKKANNIVRTEK